MADGPAWVALAMSQLGTHEVPGGRDNPAIMQFFADVGHPEIEHDEVAWCSAFAGAMLKRAGYPIPPKANNLMAMSYETYGVKLDEPRVGCICVFKRGTGWQRHVAFFVAREGDRIKVLGGNQSDSVSITSEPASALVCYRWPVAATVPELRKAGSKEIRKGDLAQNAGIFATFIAPAIAAVKELIDPVTQVPHFDSLPEGLSFGQKVMEAASGLGKVILANPWLASAVLGGLCLAWVGHTIKSHRVAKADAGAPLSSEVA